MKKKVLWIVCITVGCWLACAGSAFADLEKLTDAELIAEYEVAGLAVNGKFEEPPMDGGPRLALSFPNPRFQAAQWEILQRGVQMVPTLIAFLEQEVPKEREKNPKFNRPVSFVDDVLKMLVQINDPRAAPVALRILEGWDGKANERKQSAALGALQRLTYFSFHKIKPHRVPYQDSLEHSKAINIEYSSEYATSARLYREWLEGEGKDPSQWLELARKQARQMLASEDLDLVYHAATFLRPETGRDDDPDATLARLVEIVGKMKKGKNGYEFAGKPVPNPDANWTGMIDKLQKKDGLKILTSLFEALPKVSAQADRIRKTDGENARYTSDDPRLAALGSQREVRLGIDRWAGRVFDSDAEREAWWKENKTKSPEEWLLANLDILNEQVANDKLWAWAIAHDVLPDMPGYPYGERRPEVGKRKVEEPFRVEWLNEHRKELRYDANAGCFRLAH